MNQYDNKVFDAALKDAFEKLHDMAVIIDKQNKKIDDLEKKVHILELKNIINDQSLDMNTRQDAENELASLLNKEQNKKSK